MGSTQTPQEAKQERIAKMGQQLGEFYDRLWHDVVWAHVKWAEYVALFGDKPARVELLNKAAGSFFRVVQDVLVEDTILHIARLVDKPQTNRNPKKRNLTVLALPQLVTDEGLRSSADALAQQAASKADFCTDWRNRHLAHRDLSLALQKGPELKPASRLNIKEALAAITDALNAVSKHYLDATTCYWLPAGGIGGAEVLLRVLHDGVRAEEERLERLRKGRPRPDDGEYLDI